MESFLQNTSYYGLWRTKYLMCKMEKKMETFNGVT